MGTLYLLQDEGKCANPEGCNENCYRKRESRPESIRQVYVRPVISIDGETCLLFCEEVVDEHSGKHAVPNDFGSRSSA